MPNNKSKSDLDLAARLRHAASLLLELAAIAGDVPTACAEFTFGAIDAMYAEATAAPDANWLSET